MLEDKNEKTKTIEGLLYRTLMQNIEQQLAIIDILNKTQDLQETCNTINSFSLKLVDRLYVNSIDNQRHTKRILSEEKPSMELLSKRLHSAIFCEVGDRFKGGVEEMKIKMNEKLEEIVSKVKIEINKIG